MASNTLIDIKASADLLELAGSGAWVAANARRLETLTEQVFALDPRPVAIDARDISEFDTFGAWALERLVRGDGRRETALTGLPDRFKGLYEKVRESNRGAPRPAVKHHGLLAFFERVGLGVRASGLDVGRYVGMIGAFAVAVAAVVRRPRRLRFASLAHQIDRVGWTSIPIIVLITFLIGAIIAQQGIFHFRKFGADDYVVDLVGILILREIGVLIVSIMVAGRSGSSYTAEIGSMKMREEIDALRTMGRDPIEVLILPRIIALVVALPALTFIGSMAALLGRRPRRLVLWRHGARQSSSRDCASRCRSPTSRSA